jgi:hypothetical protein
LDVTSAREVPTIRDGYPEGGDWKEGMSNNVFSALMALILSSRSGLDDGVASPVSLVDAAE